MDESILTGESNPKEKKEKDKVYTGTINLTGVIKIISEKVGNETVLARITKLVEEAQNTKTSIQKLVDKIANIFVPIVLIISIFTFLIWYFIGPNPSYKYALITFVSVLVITCPCALGLATPTALIVGLGKGSEIGILIKGAEVLEKLNKIDTVIFDKTGTLTYGKLKVKEIIPLKNYTKDELLKIAISLETFSEHPIAKSILEEGNKTNLKEIKVENIREISGYGIEGYINGIKYFVGKIDKKDEEIDNLIKEKKINTFVGIYKEDELIGLINLKDEIRESAKLVVNKLKQNGYKVGMITGDSLEIAEEIKNELGISFLLAEVLPEEKLRKIKEIQRNGIKVAMVGDGINDAPSLAQADLGIAMGSGTDIAIEAGDIVLIGGDIRGVIRALELSEKTFNTIKWNLFWAFIYNIIGIPIAAGILYPTFKILLNPMIAGLSMAFSSIFVVSNSLRLKRFKQSI